MGDIEGGTNLIICNLNQLEVGSTCYVTHTISFARFSHFFWCVTLKSWEEWGYKAIHHTWCASEISLLDETIVTTPTQVSSQI